MAQAPENPIKLVVYDFDQTISCEHIYHHLDSLASIRTAKGQMDELEQLSDDELSDFFGGKDRLSRLDIHFERVTSVADVAIVSFGYVKVIKSSLDTVKLGKYWEDATIIGCDSMELQVVHGNKAQCIQNMRRKRNLKPEQVLFIDDDGSNIRKAKLLNSCKTIEINPRNGMTNEHMNTIEKTIGAYPIIQKNNINNKNNENIKNNNIIGNGIHNGNHNANNNENPNNNENENKNNDNNDENPNANRQGSWKDKYKIDDNAMKKFDIIKHNSDSDSATPVVDVDIEHEEDSESQQKINFVLNTPEIPSLASANTNTTDNTDDD